MLDARRFAVRDDDGDDVEPYVQVVGVVAGEVVVGDLTDAALLVGVHRRGGVGVVVGRAGLDLDEDKGLGGRFGPPATLKGDQVHLPGAALGRKDGTADIETIADSTGSARVKVSGGGGEPWIKGAWEMAEESVPVLRLDQFSLMALDFLKLDCEGYELFALQGAEETLKRCKPVVIVEQKPGRAQCHGLPERAAVEYLEGLGAKLRLEMAGDFILSWG